SINGWAMEARLYAEDPATGFLPSIGTLELLQFGEGANDFGAGRIDTGVYEGAEVSPFYDPMIAKVIAKGATRDQARERLADLLDDSAVWPVRTNTSFLIEALAHPEFVSGEVDTGLIGRDGDAMTAAPQPSAAALADAALDLIPAYDQPGFRLNAPARTVSYVLVDGEAMTVELDGEGAENPVDAVLLAEHGAVWEVTPWRKDGSHGAAGGTGAILSPMPGKIIAVEVAAGERVTSGQKLLTLEAMKMEHSLTAPFDGVVAELNAVAGAQVQVDALLVRIEAPAE
ncbi:MAG: methylcrotonoyl-CoA carboxylase, partial [Novosphingobium sp.]